MTSNTQDLRIAQARKYVTIFEVLSRFGVDLEEATQQIRCPFHDDHSPSARIYADQNKVYCFTEQKSWDIVDAVQTLLQVSLPDALAWLEHEFNIPGATATLQGTVRTQLASRPPVDVKQSAAMVEQRLLEHRRRLGFALYTRLLAALDLSVWEFSERRIKLDEFNRRMGQLLNAANGVTT